ncbi:MAG: hypothetical protein ACLRXQ_09355 [Phascolarctobacterium faecium]
MAKNKVILGHLSGSAVFLNPVCMIVTKMHFKEPDEGIIISKETIHTWEFVTDEAIKDAFAGKSDCALEGMTEEYGQELMGAVLKPPKASVYQLAVQFENGEYSLLELDGYYAKAFIDASAKEKQLYLSLITAGRRRFLHEKVVAGCISLVLQDCCYCCK